MVYKKHCCYGVCNSDSRYPDRLEMQGVFFINFPKPKTQREKCEKWIHLCGRPKEQFSLERIGKMTFICSKHFVGGNGPTAENPDPLPATTRSEQVSKMMCPRKPPTPRSTCAPVIKRRKLLDDGVAIANTQGTNAVGTQTEPVVCLYPKETADQSCQTVYDKYLLQMKVDNMILQNKILSSSPLNTVQQPKNKQSKATLSIEDMATNERKMKFFTGLTYLHFIALFNFLGPVVNNLTYWNRKKGKTRKMSTKPIDELLITLVRLRRGFCFYTLSMLFNLPETCLRSIFTTWLQLLYCHFNELRSKMFPERSHLKLFMPKSFKCFKNFRCSVDCTEFFVQMPRDFTRQGNLYSNYKHHHTFKCLIAVAPNGTAVFVSELYEGALSDRDIFEQCGILNYLNPDDLLLVDRGFTVEDLLLPRQVHMNIPPFLRGREKLTPQEEQLTRKIAKARIHIERFNERIKKFRLISGIMPLNMTPLATQAVFVACCLVNFQDQLAT